jgi:hypothetical protein
MTDTCSICDDPIEGQPETRTAHGSTYHLCSVCADWGYLASAFEPHRTPQWHRARIFGAVNAAAWSRGRQAPGDFGVHVPYHLPGA